MESIGNLAKKVFNEIKAKKELNKMSPEEFKLKMIEINKLSEVEDVEEAHGLADGLMCEVLEQLGYKEGIEIFNQMSKWYS